MSARGPGLTLEMLRGPTAARVVSRRYHFHWPGLAYAACSVVLVFGAINGQNNLLFWLFGLAVAGLIVSGLVSGVVLMRLELAREVARTATVAEPLMVLYTIRNRAWLLPAMALHIEELSTAGKPNPLGRVAAAAPFVPARGEVTVRAMVRPLRRGVATMHRLRVWTTFPFGLMKKSVTFEQESSVLVRPAAAVIDPALWRLVRGGIGGEVRAGGRHGDEFHALREYAPGASARRIAWRATARLGRPVIRELANLASSDVHVELDARHPDGWEHAVSAAAGVAIDGARRGFAVGLSVGATAEPAARGARHLDRILDLLAIVQPLPTSPAPAHRSGAVRVRAEPGGARVECGDRVFAVPPLAEAGS